LEYAKQGIRVNCVCPGYIETPMTELGRNDPERMAHMLASEPIGRLGTPEEIAETVVWLCSDAASGYLPSWANHLSGLARHDADPTGNIE
jgi:NAD(P)-dependent dehydrogenase (short-subunit alcohol dehydrogenase family)